MQKLTKHAFGWCILLFLCSILANAQKRDTLTFQLTGVVLTNDSTPQLIPYAHIIVRGRNQGAMSQDDGFFSIAVVPGDTIQFSAIGFKRERFYIPDTMASDKKGYLAQIFLVRDTTMLQEVVIYPWPRPDRLKDEFMAIRMPTTDLDIARRNLAIQSLRERAMAMGADASETAKHVMRAQAQDQYNYNRWSGVSGGGQAMMMTLSNPFAWAELFESLKSK